MRDESMNRKKIFLLYLRVSSLFLLLVFFVSIFPTVTSAGVRAYKQMGMGSLRNTYLVVDFYHETPPSEAVSDLKPGEFGIDTGLAVYRSFLDGPAERPSHPPLPPLGPLDALDLSDPRLQGSQTAG